MNKKFLSVAFIASCAAAFAAHADNIKTQRPGTMVIQPKQQKIQAEHASALRQGKANRTLQATQPQANPYNFHKNANGVSR